MSAAAALKLLPSLPLLGKELVEAAARRRTYALRCALAAALLLVFGVAYASLSHSIDPLGMLGRGRELCDALFWTLLVCVALLQPAISATTVTHEKEQGTLVLLLLTPLRPWDLVLQKWLSRQLAMLGLLLPALPLMAVAYAHGGISSSRIWIAIAALIVAVAQISALSLAISCWCRGSTAATFLSYLACAAVLLGQPLLETMHGSPFLEPTLQICTAYAYLALDAAAAPGGSVSGPAPYFVGPLVTTLLFLLAARASIARRASLTGGSIVLRAFRGLDGIYERLETRLFGRRIARDLPGDRPIAWREANRRSFANLRYLARMFVPIYAIVAFLMVALALDAERTTSFVLLYDSLLGLATLASVVHGAGVVSGERAGQTLEILLTTPMSAREIVAQKATAMRRLRIGMGCALVLVALAGAACDWLYGGEPSAMRLATELAAAVLVPSLASWMSLWIALRSRTQLRAIVGSMLAILAWFLGVPLLIAAVLAILDQTSMREPTALGLLASPAVFVLFGQWKDLDGMWADRWLLWGACSIAYAVASAVLRASCLRGADALLRRGPDED